MPSGYWAKANNARFSAYYLRHATNQNDLGAIAADANYLGTVGISLWEAYLREAALALELVTKAVIARRIQKGVAAAHVVRVRHTHDVPTLWKEADLPKLEQDDQKRLLLSKYILSWSGRYPAPKTDADVAREMEEWAAIQGNKSENEKLFNIGLRFDWPDFDKIYQIALRSLVELADF